MKTIKYTFVFAVILFSFEASAAPFFPQPKYQNGSILSVSPTPSITSGFGISPSISGQNSSAFDVTIGTGGTDTSGVLTFGASAVSSWVCSAVNKTNYSSSVPVVVPTSTTTVTIYNYVRTTGVLGAFTPEDVISVACTPN